MKATPSVCAALVLVSGAARAQIAFGPATTIPTPSSPDGMAAGDFNNDGRIDLVVATDSPPKVTILPARINGTFDAPINIALPAGSGPNYVRAVDMNGDNILDLVVTLRDAKQVKILIGDGHFGFTVGATFPTGNSPRWTITRPLHGGSSNDIVVANRADGTLTVLLHGSGLNFTSSTVPCGTDPRAIAGIDVTGDNAPELFVTSFGDRTFVRLNNDGAGHFTQGGSTLVGSDRRPNGIYNADLNGDGKQDLIVANADTSGNGFATVYLNTNNTFPTGTSYPTLGLNPGQVIAADMDRDGKLDLAVVHPDSNTVATLRNVGAGFFSAPQTINTGVGPRMVVITDFDQDYIPDIAVSNLGSGTVSVMLNTLPSPPCYANFDNSTAQPILNVNDFEDFMTAFTLGQTRANCDNSTSPPILNPADFNCFINKFAAGCS